MHSVRRGSGRPLLLIHGLGGNHRSWDTIAGDLAAQRELVLVDLPGFGESPPLPVAPTVAALADALEGFLDEQGLDGVDVVGSSLGARLVLELVRRGRVGAAVALDPGGFWNPREQAVFAASLKASIRLIRAIRPALPVLTGNPVTRTLLLGQLSGAPWRLDGDVVRRELDAYATAPAFDATLQDLAHGPGQAGAPAGTARGRLVIVWGRRDLVTIPRQAARAARRFPDAELVWVDGSGHFPQWDAPAETIRIVLETTAG